MSKSITAVILCGPGHNLWPLQRPPKALLPIANTPLVEQTLNWTEQAGLTDVLILAPAIQQSSLSHFLRARRQREGKSSLKTEFEVFGEDIQGTARVIAWAASQRYLRGDFVLLPCDLAIHASPHNTGNVLADLLQSFRSRDDLVATLFYERGSIEKTKDTQSKFMTLWDPKTHTLLDMKDTTHYDDEIPLRGSLLSRYPALRLSTNILPAHIYVCSSRVLAILASIPRFESFKMDFIPFLAKAQWQSGLLQSYADAERPLLEVAHPQALALSHSSTAPIPRKRIMDRAVKDYQKQPRPSLRNVRSSVYGTLLTSAYSSNDVRPSDTSPRPASDAAHWPRSNAVTIRIWSLKDGICTRVHSVAAYAELNRLALKASAQPEGVVGHHLVLGERASIKRCAIGDNCSIGKLSRLSGCVVMDNVAIGEGAKLENCIIASSVRIGDNSNLSACEIGEGTVIESGTTLKGEKLSHD